MSLKVYNTLTKKKEDFTTIEEGKVRMYVCGPTVYDFLHIGNFFGAIFFNAARNWMEKLGYEVTYVYNYTDVDDKIINRANEEGVEAVEIAEKYIEEFRKDYECLKLKPQTFNPRVSEHMGDIIGFIKILVEKGHAYEVEGDVYFSVPSFKEYGKLSNKNLDDMESGYRIEVDERKKHAADFALWKRAKEGEPSWESPWSAGRPGWHIECSAMAKALLGDTIDIHGGGLDLAFPHHENEIAQSQCCNDKTYASYWMHNNMLTFGDQKMSKSLGNVLTGRGFLEKYNGEILKYMILSSHYRSTIDFSEAQVERTIQSLAKFYSALALAEDIIASPAQLAPVPEKFQHAIDEASVGITESMNDDFNTSGVMARFFEVVRLFNSYCRTPGKIKPEQKAVAEVFYHWLRDKSEMMALFQESPKEYLVCLDDMLLGFKNIERSQVDDLVAQRTQARVDKNYQKSDEIRDQLAEMGIAVQDSVEGSTWEVAK